MIKIMPIGAQDRAAWTPLWRAYLAYYETELADDIYDIAFARLTDPKVTAYHGFLAWDGIRPLGLVHYIYHMHGWKIEPVCYLQDLYTVPDARHGCRTGLDRGSVWGRRPGGRALGLLDDAGV